MTPSSMHGVTTAVMGNCGVGFAPCKPGRSREAGRVDGRRRGHSRPRHARGPEVGMGVVRRVPRPRWSAAIATSTCARCCRTPRCACSSWASGRLRLENANQADIAQMREIAADAMRAGAFGFSTSRSLSHKSLKGDPTPTLRAQEDELTGIAHGHARRGFGLSGDRVGMGAGSKGGVRHDPPRGGERAAGPACSR